MQTIMNSAIQPERNNDSSAFEAGARTNIKPIGASGTELYSGYFSEEYLQELRGRRGAKLFDEIRRSESQIAMILNAVMNPIKAATWEFEAAEVEGGENHKELVEFCAKEMVDWQTHVHEALTFMVFGYSVFEIVNNVVYNHPKFGTFNGLRALAFRSQKSIERWNVDNGTGELRSVTQYTQGDLTPGHSSAQMVDLPAEFLLIMTLQKEGDNYEGISALRPMYGPWFRKNLYQKLIAIGIEQSAIGTPLGTIPAGKQDTEQTDAFKEMLSNFTAHESAYLIKPAGWEVELIRNQFDPAKIKEVIVLENTEMVNSVVANFLSLGMNGGSGSFALGTDLSDFFLTGLQNYADIVCGVWNRRLIPTLVKQNFGEQQTYPQLKATGINDKAGKELAEIIGALVGNNVIKADMKLEEFLRKQYRLPKVDLTSTREPAAPAPSFGPAQFSESSILLAEKDFGKQIDKDRDKVKAIMEKELVDILDDYKKQIARLYKAATPQGRQAIALKLEPKTTKYNAALKEIFAEIALRAYNDAKKETPKVKNIKLNESIQLAAPRGGYFDALPPHIKTLVRTQAALVSGTQAADLEKIVTFQYSTSQASTENLDQILLDISSAATPTIEGATAKGVSTTASAGNAVSTIVNQARLDWFFEPEVLDTIESFTFFNEDPVSEVCQELDGTTWAVGDPDIDRYSPPLHHNCKSRIKPNSKGAEGNPKTVNGTSLSKKALNAITLCEKGSCDGYHLQLVEGDK